MAPWLSSSNIRGMIALTIVIGGGIGVLLVWFFPVNIQVASGNTSVTRTQDPMILITAIIGLIGGVSGHFFGSRGVDNAQKQAVDAEVASAKASETALATVEQAEKLLAPAKRAEKLIAALRRDPAVKAKLESTEAQGDLTTQAGRFHDVAAELKASIDETERVLVEQKLKLSKLRKSG
jgi:hypothetical protein